MRRAGEAGGTGKPRARPRVATPARPLRIPVAGSPAAATRPL